MLSIMQIIRRVERALIAIVLIAMALLYFVNVLVRELQPALASQFVWIEEATLFALAWLVFVGLGLTLERRRHIAMTFMLDELAPRALRVTKALIDLAGLIVALILAKLSFDLAQFIYQSGQISPTLGISMVVLYAPMPIGFALLALRYFLELIGLQNRFAVQPAANA